MKSGNQLAQITFLDRCHQPIELGKMSFLKEEVGRILGWLAEFALHIKGIHITSTDVKYTPHCLDSGVYFKVPIWLSGNCSRALVHGGTSCSSVICYDSFHKLNVHGRLFRLAPCKVGQINTSHLQVYRYIFQKTVSR